VIAPQASRRFHAIHTSIAETLTRQSQPSAPRASYAIPHISDFISQYRAAVCAALYEKISPQLNSYEHSLLVGAAEAHWQRSGLTILKDTWLLLYAITNTVLTTGVFSQIVNFFALNTPPGGQVIDPFRSTLTYCVFDPTPSEAYANLRKIGRSGTLLQAPSGLTIFLKASGNWSPTDAPSGERPHFQPLLLTSDGF